MLSRRHIRVKVMQLVYAFNNSESVDLNLPQKLLIQSMEDMYNLYLLLVSLIVEVHLRAESYQDKSKLKHLATQQEKNPNKKFVDNRLLKQLRENTLFKEALNKRKPNDWKLDNEYVDIIFKKILDSDIYKNYMNSDQSSFKEDKKFVIDVFKIIIAPDEKLYEYIEDNKLTWLDDLPVINTGIVKLLKKAGHRF